MKAKESRRSGSPEPKGRLLPFFEPMMAKLLKVPPPGHWRYEVKYDGFRALAFLAKDNIQLLSRNGKDLSGKFPGVIRSLKMLEQENTILDGEIVALDPKGLSSFQLLQAYELGTRTPSMFYYIFDLPQHEGADLRSLPLEDRRARLQKLLRRRRGNLRLSESVEGDGAVLLEKARQLGLEGLIGKRTGSLYEAGRRSGAWIKLKTHREQEFVIGGYTEPAGARSHFGAILAGVYQEGKLIYCGKVGTGFNAALLESLSFAFQKLATSECPFENLRQPGGRRAGTDLSPAEVKRCHWLRPRLVCQVRFSEWTRDGKLRQPVFLGLRDDKDAKDVVREEPS